MHRPAPPNASISCTSVAKARAFVYLLRCADGTLYCGWTVDVERRVAAHNAGRASRYTRSRLPLQLAWAPPPPLHALPAPRRAGLVAPAAGPHGGDARRGADQAAPARGQAGADRRGGI